MNGYTRQDQTISKANKLRKEIVTTHKLKIYLSFFSVSFKSHT